MTESRTAEDRPDVSQADIDALGSKLAAWSESLSGAERAIAQQLVERARTLTPATLAVNRISADLNSATRALINKLNLPLTPVGWAQIGPVWQKANPTVAEDYNYYGDQITLIQRVDLTIRPTSLT
jgi:hypothetical protein